MGVLFLHTPYCFMKFLKTKMKNFENQNTQSETIRILLVEDEPDQAYLLTEQFRIESGGYELEWADCLAKGLELLEIKKFDFVFLDLQLPDSKGLDTVDSLVEQFPLMPVIVLTALNDEGLGLEAIKKGAQDFIIKGGGVFKQLSRSLNYAIVRKKLESKLQQSEKRFKNLVVYSTDSIAQLDSQGRFLYMNPSGIKINELDSFEDIEGRECFFNVREEFKGTLRESLAKAEKGERILLEYISRTPRGKEIWWEAVVSPNIEDKIDTEGFTMISREITERKKAEEQVKKLSVAVEQSPAAIIITDPDGNIEYVNRKFVRVTGYSLEEALGQNPRILKSGETSPEEYKRLWDVITSGGEWRGEFHNKKKNGELFWESAVISPIKNQMGGIIHFLGVKEDITERKRADEALRQSEVKYKNLTDNLKPLIYRANPKTFHPTYVNKSVKDIYGYTKNEWLDNPDLWEDLIFSEDKERVIWEIEETIGKLDNAIIKYRIIRKDKSIRWVEDNISLEKDQNGKIVSLNGVVYDITEKILSEEILRRSEKLASLGTLSAGVAHEILNPLNIINALVQMMKRKSPAPEDLKKNLEEIMSQVSRAAKIADNLRMFARKKEGEIKPVDLHALFDKTLILLEHDLNLENVQVEKLYDKDLSLIKADEDHLSQVFLNLLNNAKDAMQGGAGNIVTLRTKVLEDEVEIRFSDTGPGIPEEFLEKIFDPFFTTKGPGKGTGLGLSITHSIIENHGGTLRVESAEGKGTTFVITLPVGGSKEKERKSRE